MKSEICPVCGGETVVKAVIEVIQGGGHTASLKVKAEVCQHCGESLFTSSQIRYFEEIKAKLERQETEEFEPVETAF